ncbi:MAG: hypothetical protein ACKVT0_16955 [Planctomycetaceae bacterium]
MFRLLFLLELVLLSGQSISAADEPDKAIAGPSIWVSGTKSDNIVKFDLNSGEVTVVARLPNGSRPRALAIDAKGQVFVGLNGNKKNIVKLVPGRPNLVDGPLVAVDLTAQIGRFGPGLMAFDRNGLLNVAGDTERMILRYNVETGEAVDPLRTSRRANLVGLTVQDDTVFVAEYFQKKVLRIDTGTMPVQAAILINGEGMLDRPHGMTIGHSNNLFVSNLQDDRVVEANPQTGEIVGVFMDVKTIGARGVSDLRYSRELDHYFITSGDTVYELASDGSLIARFTNPSLSIAWSVLVFAPSSVTPPTLPASVPATPVPIPIIIEPTPEQIQIEEGEQFDDGEAAVIEIDRFQRFEYMLPPKRGI